MLGPQQGFAGGRGIGQMQVVNGFERGLHGGRGVVQRLANLVRQQLQHLVVLGQHGGAPVQQGAQFVHLACRMLAAAQLLVQGLKLFALAGHDLAARIFTADIVHQHQHTVAAICTGRAGPELNALVLGHAQLILAAFVVFLGQALARCGNVLGVAAPDVGRQQRLHCLAQCLRCLNAKPLQPGLCRQLQPPLRVPQGAAQSRLTQQAGQRRLLR